MINRGRKSRSALLRRRQILRKLLPVETLEIRRVLSALPLVEQSPIDVESVLNESPAQIHHHDDSHDAHGHDGHGHDDHCNCDLCSANHGLPLPTDAEIQAALDEVPEPPLASAELTQTFLLHSNPGATKTIYLDFDGETTSGTIWNSSFNGNEDIVTPAYSYTGDSSFTDAEKTRIFNIWQRVSEDFVPFDVNVTTEEPDTADLKKSGSGDTQWGIRVVIGGGGSWYGSAGGTGYVGSFRWGSDTPVFVFPDRLGNGNEKYTAEAISHETGHALGLYHDGRTDPVEEYYGGSGSGATGWAPIMGNSYSKSLTQWSKGEYANASNTSQDDLTVITSSSNGFGFRDDDHGSDIAGASSLIIDNGSVSGDGIIEQTDDIDVFSFSTDGGSIDFSVDPFERGPNLDINATLYSAAGALLLTSNPTASLAASLATTLAAGQYFVKVEGIGNGDPASGGYSDYASLGQYSISGTISGGVVAEKTQDDSFTVDEDSGTTTLDVLNNDTAGSSPLSISGLGTASQGGTISIQAGASIAYTPATDFFGTETFTYTVNDGAAGADSTATVTMTVNSINSAPIAVDDTYSVDEDSDTKGWNVLLNDSTESDETLSVNSVSVGSNGGTVTNAGNGFVNYKPVANFFGTETFTYTAGDGTPNSTDSATVTITVRSVNDDPIAANDSFTVAEDSGNTTFDVLANDTTEVGESLTITAVGAGSAGGTLTILNGDSVRYRPADNFFGTETFTYTVNDGQTGSNDTATVTVSVTSVNDKPVASNDSFTVAEDSGNTTFDVLANDSTEAGESLTITAVGAGSAGGTLTILNGDSIRYRPADNFFGTETFTYTVNDGQAGSNDTATVTVSVTSVNDKPVASNDSFTVAEDSGNTTFDVLANDTTESGESLTITAVGTGSAGGTLTILNGDSIRYRPADNFFGTETFSYTVNDGQTGSNDTATVTVSVTSVNDKPVASNDSFTVAEDSGNTTFDVLANDTTESGESLTITAVGAGSAGGTLTILNGDSIRYRPADNFFGTETFTYTVNDGNAGSNDTATVTVSVTSVNDKPVANDDSFTVAEDSGNTTFDVLANDTTESGESLTITAVGAGSAGGTLTILNGDSIRYRPADNFFGSETFTYTVNDGKAGSNDTATVTVSVTSVNDKPVANDDSFTVAEDSGNTTFDVLANDTTEVGESLTITAVGTGSAGGTLTILNGDSIRYRPADNFFGTETFTYTVNDGQTGSNDTATVTVSVTSINDKPVANNDSFTVAEDSGNTTFDVLANDTTESGESLTITAVGTGSAGGTLTILNGDSIRYRPADNFFGTETFSYTVNDGKAGSNDTATVTVSVTSVNDKPVANDDSFLVDEDAQNTTLDVLANDTTETGESLTITSVGAGSAGGSLTIVDGDSIVYRPANNFSGTETFIYTVNDGNVGSNDSATVTVNVSSVNDRPVANDDSFTVAEDSGNTTLDVLANDTTEAGESLTITAVGAGSAGGTLTILDGNSVRYRPADNFFGTETFTYTVNDGNAGSNDTATVTVSVTSVNDKPVANNDSFTVAEDSGNTTFDVLANDTTESGESLTITAVGTGSAGGTLTILNGDSIRYRPADNFFGSETFTYTVNDGNAGSNDTATVTVSVTSVNDKPVANNDSFTVAEDSGNTTFDVLANDTTEAGESLTITAVGAGSAGGTLTILNGDSIRYRPADNFFGTETFTYTVNDGQTGSNDTATVTVSVTSVNDKPVASNDSFTVAEDSGNTTFDVLANDSTEAGESLTITAVGAGSAGGTLTILNGDSIRYRPADNFFGTETFTYTVNDGKAGSNDTATVTVSVTSVNDKPVANNDSFTVSQNSPNRTFNVLANDSTEAGETLSILSTGAGSQGGWLQISNGTSILYRPANNFFGTETFTYTVGDGLAGSTDTATVTVTVNENQGGPTMDRVRIHLPRRDYLQLAEVEVIEKGTGNNIALVGTATQSTSYDANSGPEQAIDGDRVSGYPTSLSHTKLETGAWWELDLNSDIEVESITVFNRDIAGGRLEGAIIEGFSGEQLVWSSTITGAADRSQHRFTPEIVIQNDAPVANDDAYQLSQDSGPTNFGVLVNDTTDSGETLTITSTSNGSDGGSVDIVNGNSITYQPADGFSGTETFTYTVNDGTPGNDDTASVTVNVLPTPDGTTINRVRIHLPGRNYLTLAEVEVIEAGTQQNLALAGVASQSTTYDQNSGAEQATDGDRVSGYPTSLAHTELEKGAWWEVDLGAEFAVETITVYNRDIAGQRLEGAVIEAFTGINTLVWSNSIEGAGDGSQHRFNPTGGSDNPPPTANNDAFSVDENSNNTEFDVLANDTTEDGELLSITSVGAGSRGGWLAIVNSSSILYRPAADFVGTETFSYTINDGNPGNDDSATVTVSVDAVNEVPVASDDSYQLSQNSGPTNFGVLANDSTDLGETLTITTVGVGSGGGNIDIVDGTSIRYQPANGFVGIETFTYTVNDGTPGSSDTATVSVNVTAVANGTTINRVRIHLPGRNYLTLAEVEVIEAGSATNLARLGTATQSTTYDQNSGAEQAIDGDRISGYPTSLSHTELEIGAWWDIDLGAEFAIDTISIFNRDIAGQRLKGAVVTAYTGVDTVVWTDSIDKAKNGSRHDFHPTAGNDNLPPSANDDAFSVQENSGNTELDVLANDTTDSGETLSITSVGGGSQGGWLAIVNSSSILYRPAPDFVGTETFTYTVNDGQPGNDDTATVSITVTAEPEPQLVQKIRILHPQRQYLTLAEVEVVALEGGANLAVNGVATQSTTYDNNTGAEQAIDGDRDSGYPTSLSHSKLEVGAWWQVDLGQAFALSSVRVFNREIAGQRLEGAIVQAFSADNTIIWSAPITGASDSSVHEFDLSGLSGPALAPPALLSVGIAEAEAVPPVVEQLPPETQKVIQSETNTAAPDSNEHVSPWRNRLRRGDARAAFFSALGSSQKTDQLDQMINDLF